MPSEHGSPAQQVAHVKPCPAQAKHNTHAICACSPEEQVAHASAALRRQGTMHMLPAHGNPQEQFDPCPAHLAVGFCGRQHPRDGHRAGSRPTQGNSITRSCSLWHRGVLPLLIPSQVSRCMLPCLLHWRPDSAALLLSVLRPQQSSCHRQPCQRLTCMRNRRSNATHSFMKCNILSHGYLQAGRPEVPSSQNAAMLGTCMGHAARSRSSQRPVPVAGLCVASQPVPQHATCCRSGSI